MLIISLQQAACESPPRSNSTQKNLKIQIVVKGVSVMEFDPKTSVIYLLKSGNRHVTHKHHGEVVAGYLWERGVSNVRPLKLLV